ncbi:MAG: hypothetical protein ACXVUL_15185 [Solirubrobacteraceae bacterium]
MTTEGSNPHEGEDTLRRLEERLDRASAAAERLMAEAMHGAGNPADSVRDPEPPPSGWQAPEAEDSSNRDSDLEALIALARSVRDLIPPELQQRLINALREVLQALRDLLDWYLERLDRQRAEPAQVQDIPIL